MQSGGGEARGGGEGDTGCARVGARRAHHEGSARYAHPPRRVAGDRRGTSPEVIWSRT